MNYRHKLRLQLKNVGNNMTLEIFDDVLVPYVIIEVGVIGTKQFAVNVKFPGGLTA